MPKRFIDTEIFKKKSMKILPSRYKLLYIYMFCECNHAGIWDVELDVAALRLELDFDEKEVLAQFGDSLRKIKDGKWYLTDFVEFQYGKLNPENRAHKSVIEILKKYKIKPLRSPLQGCKDMDTDTDTDKELDKDKDKSKERIPTLNQWLEYAKEKNYPANDAEGAFDHYVANGWVQGKNKPIKDWKAALRTCKKRYETEPNNQTGGKGPKRAYTGYIPAERHTDTDYSKAYANKK